MSILKEKEVEKFLNRLKYSWLCLAGEGELMQSLPSSGEEKAGFGTSLVRTSDFCVFA